MGEPIRPYNLVQALDRGIAIIEALFAAEDGLTLHELSEEVQVHKTTTLRLLGTLLARRYVCHDERTGRYQIDLARMFLLHGIARGLQRRVATCHDALVELSRVCGETACLAAADLDRRELVVLDEAPPEHHPLSISRLIGLRLPVHATAMGRAFLAALPEPDVIHWLSTHPLVAYTDQTICDPQRLLEEVRRARRDGYAISVDESDAGITGIAAALQDETGNIAIVAIAGPSSRFCPSEATVSELRLTASRIATALGHSLVAPAPVEEPAPQLSGAVR
jgi:DNA-binding IclR family transcriptional regulator